MSGRVGMGWRKGYHMGRDSPSGPDWILDTKTGLRSGGRLGTRTWAFMGPDRTGPHDVDSASPMSCAEFDVRSPDASALANAVTASAGQTNCVSARSH